MFYKIYFLSPRKDGERQRESESVRSMNSPLNCLYTHSLPRGKTKIHMYLPDEGVEISAVAANKQAARRDHHLAATARHSHSYSYRYRYRKVSHRQRRRLYPRVCSPISASLISVSAAPPPRPDGTHRDGASAFCVSPNMYL